ncbi:bifunctional DNA-formamidopyrimidine glycosylase/DNA-(apurinic or apyrimidinic site) lyase [soil metagenome]
MPELPEIEVLHRDLEKEVVSRRFKDVEIRPGSTSMKLIPRHGRRKEFQDLLVGAKVERARRVGRHLLMDLDNGQTMVVQLGSHGQMVKVSASGEVAPHTHIVMTFTIGGQLRIICADATTEVFVAPTDEVKGLEGMQDYEIDPLESPLAWQHFSAILEQKARPMKELLADEKFIVGLGGLYSDEILFTSGLRYDRQSDKLSSQDVRRLYRSLMETLQEAVKLRGTSLGEHEFTDLTGQPGTYQIELKVYEREGEFCRRCRNDIRRVSFNGTDTYFCPQCQT